MELQARSTPPLLTSENGPPWFDFVSCHLHGGILVECLLRIEDVEVAIAAAHFQNALQFSKGHVKYTVTRLRVEDVLGTYVDLVVAGQGVRDDDLLLLHLDAGFALQMADGWHLLELTVLALLAG